SENADKVSPQSADHRESILHLSNSRLAAIVQSSDDAIISKDLNGVIETWNKAAERIFGYTSDEMIGQSITRLIPRDRPNEEGRILERIRSGQSVDHFETERVRKDGRRIDVSVTISPIRDSTGRVVGASKVARDITDRRAAEREREQLLSSERSARSEAERINRVKDEFLATLSHELRTPLNAVLGWAHLLSTGKLDGDETADAVATIERNARMQMQLIEDLLDMSRIISGRIRLDIQRIELPVVIAAAAESLKLAAAAKQIDLTQEFDPGVGRINGDSGRLQQVMWNLLSNAIKFTPSNGKVSIHLRPVDSTIQIVVSDTGQGIDPEFIPRLFGRFQQADGSTTRRHGGLGLGLAICKNLIELHGGNIEAQSAGLGKGTTFTISLPRHQMPISYQPAAVHGSDDEHWVPRLKDVRIMVVDDEHDSRELVKRVLGSVDAEVTVVGSAVEALDTLPRMLPDVLISDIGMPGIDGYELLRRIRQLPAEEGGSVPAVALTAFARSEDRMKALMSGYQMHVSKPVEPSELVAVVASLVVRFSKR
ncbi:MAG TPA: PAS domain S-box protein, partial [Tepidisphaeraceae bacterium]|nr:PAS domain S-box protein [Tepidisphaeraceae bacterium]